MKDTSNTEQDRKENQEEAEKKQEQEVPPMVEKSVSEQPSSTLPQDLSVSQFLDIIIAADKKLSHLIQLFENKIAEDETRGILFQKLHEELTQYREDFVFDKILRRVFEDLIRLFDRINKVKDDFSSTEVEKDVIEGLESFSKEIIQILKRQEVTIIKTEKDKFDERFQEATEIVYTDNPEEELDIAEIIKKGFVYRGRTVLRPEIVKVKKYKGEKS